MNYFVICGLCMITGMLFSGMALVDENIRSSRIFRYTGIALFLVLFLWVSSSARATLGGAGDVGFGGGMAIAFSVVIPLAASCIMWAFFGAVCFVEAIAQMTRNALGLNSMRVAPFFSKAEAAVARHEFKEAEVEYRGVMERHPDEAIAFRKFAEFLVKVKRPLEARQYFEQSAMLEKDVSARMTDRFAVSDILVEDVKDIPGAIQYLERYAETEKDTRVQGYVADRIAMYRQRM
jgi:hypothetical protein